MSGKTDANVLIDSIRILRMTGRCATGAEKDGGRLFHAVKDYRALCRAKPGRMSGWSDKEGEKVTCRRCLKKLREAEKK